METQNLEISKNLLESLLETHNGIDSINRSPIGEILLEPEAMTAEHDAGHDAHDAVRSE